MHMMFPTDRLPCRLDTDERIDHHVSQSVLVAMHDLLLVVLPAVVSGRQLPHQIVHAYRAPIS